jgi:ubiquinone/menaquinone biosynthesis C-methylase UbiE
MNLGRGARMTAVDASMRRYYAARAPEYDRVYQKPERQPDIRRLQQWLPPIFAGSRVLEIACGTGFWTQYLAPVASELVGLDTSPETLLVAKQRVPPGKVRFLVGDAYRLPQDQGRFDAAFAGFWFSHVPKQRRLEFLTGLARALEPGATVVLLDNIFVAGSNLPISDPDPDGDTYQSRMLDDGSTHRVLKNFPSESELRAAVAELAERVEFTRFDYYWALQFVTVRR